MFVTCCPDSVSQVVDRSVFMRSSCRTAPFRASKRTVVVCRYGLGRRQGQQRQRQGK